MSKNEEIILRIKTMMDTGDVKGATSEIQAYFNKLNPSEKTKTNGFCGGMFHAKLDEKTWTKYRHITKKKAGCGVRQWCEISAGKMV